MTITDILLILHLIMSSTIITWMFWQTIEDIVKKIKERKNKK